MSLDVLLEPIPERSTNKRCKVGRFADGLPEKYQKALVESVALLAEFGGLTDQELTERLNKAGLSVGATVVHLHRRGKCACSK